MGASQLVRAKNCDSSEAHCNGKCGEHETAPDASSRQFVTSPGIFHLANLRPIQMAGNRAAWWRHLELPDPTSR